MARTELPNGVILPAEYSDDWYDDMTSNLSKLDEVIGSDADKLSAEDVGAAALSNDYTDLDNKPALKPVATSGDYDDLDNKPDLKPVATSGDYDDLTDLPTYGITRFCSSAITDNSSVAFSAISSTNKIKVGDFLLDTVGKFYQISSVDTSNETVSVTTPLTQLAVDSGVMHKSGNETKNGELTLSDTLNSSGIVPRSNNTYDFGSVSKLLRDLYTYHGYFRGQQQGDEYSTNARTNLTLLANRDSVGQSGCVVDTFRENTLQGTGSHILGISMKENSVRYQGCRFSWFYDNDNNGYIFALRPTIQGTNLPIKYELGNSLSKWSTINGLNPGALSLPDTSNAIDISGYITDLTGSTNTYTALADGYVSIRITGTAMRIAVTNGVESSCQRSASGAVACYVPVVAGETVSVYAVGTSVNNAIFRPCKGNV